MYEFINLIYYNIKSCSTFSVTFKPRTEFPIHDLLFSLQQKLCFGILHFVQKSSLVSNIVQLPFIKLKSVQYGGKVRYSKFFNFFSPNICCHGLNFKIVNRNNFNYISFSL